MNPLWKAHNALSWILLLFVAVNGHGCSLSGPDDESDDDRFPVQASVLVDGVFVACEGITFNGEGDLFVAGNQALWRVGVDGTVTHVADGHTNLGLAAIGDRDILWADFGPTNVLYGGWERDGIVWRVTPEGDSLVVADSILDPNFILVMDDGSFLISDDHTDEIWIVAPDGTKEIFTRQIDYPNGMALSTDGSRLFISQMYRDINPLFYDGRLWALNVENGRPLGDPEIVIDLGYTAANDGLAVDVLGRIYLAAWGAGQIWRIDPQTSDTLLIARGMAGVSSLAFGRGDFNHQSIYATSSRVGTVWVVPVGVEGTELHR